MDIHFKKVSTLVVLAAMSLSLFGCGKEANKSENTTKNNEKLSSVTADELFINTYNTDNVSSGDMDLYLLIDGSVDFEGTKVDTKAEIDFNITFKDIYSRMKGSYLTEALGQEYKVDMDSYIINNGDEYSLYVQVPGSDEWETTTTTSNSDVTSYIRLINIDKELCKDFKVTENDKYYIARGTVKLKDITSAVGMTTSEFFNNTEIKNEEEFDNTDVNIDVSFDKETKKPMNYKLTINECKLDDISLNKMIIELTVNDVNNTKLDIPSEILQKESYKDMEEKIYEEMQNKDLEDLYNDPYYQALLNKYNEED